MTEIVPALSWYHVTYDMIWGGTHIHVQGANGYPGLRFIWTLNTYTNERQSRFFIKGKEYPSLVEALKTYPTPPKRKRKRIRL